MNLKQTRLVVVTASHPWGSLETFFDPELEQLAALVELVVVPVWPRAPRPRTDTRAAQLESVVTGPFSARVLGSALAELVRHPRTSWRGLRTAWGQGSAQTRVRHLSVVPKGLWLARYVRRTHVSHLHAYWASVPATVAMVAAEATGTPWSFTAHRGDVHQGSLLPRKVLSTSAVRCISEATVPLLRAAVAPAPLAVAHPVVHLGVDVPERAPRWTRPTRPARVVCAAQLIPLKRHADLLRAVRRLLDDGRDLELELAGEGPMRDELQATARALGIADRVHFLGQVPNPALLERYRSGATDIVVLASEVEGIPVSLMEAMAAEVPVVATDVGGVRELLGDGAGVLVPTHDSASLASGIGSLLDDDVLRTRVAQAGRRRIEEHFDARVTAARLAGQLASG